MDIYSLMNRLPGRPRGLAPVRHPSNTMLDFRPVRPLRTAHCRDDWRRILDAQDNMVALPPVDLLKVGSRYFIVDGHKRVAAARRVGAAVGAIVVELRLPLASAA